MKSKEQYLAYLKSEHWDKLRTVVLERDGHKCTRCSSTILLQAHHLFYRASWEESIPQDLITLCRLCHEKEHGIIAPKSEVTSYEALMRARSTRQISRDEFLRLRPTFKRKKRKRNNSRRRKLAAEKARRLRDRIRAITNSSGPPVRRFRIRPIYNWINRDKSSN